MLKKYRYILLSILSGLLLFLSFPDPNFSFFAWLALIPLLMVISGTNAKKSFLYGLLAGFVSYLLQLYWIWKLIQFNTHSWQQAAICLSALSLYLALYPAVWAFLLKNVDHSKSVFRFSLFAACAWVMLEYVRTYLLTGFPWNLLGYSQYKTLPLIQICEYTGVYGISFLIILVNVGIFQFVRTRRVLPFLSLAALLTVLVIGGYAKLNRNYYSAPPYITVAVLQPNIDQYKKWDTAYEGEILNTFTELVASATAHSPDVVVWPETAIPGYLPSNAYMYAWVSSIARKSNTFHLIGTPYYNGGTDYFNAVLLFNSNGEASGWHKKVHLVPFGEYTPFRPLLSKYFDILNTLGDFKRDKEVTPLSIKSVLWGTTICSENFFGSVSRRFTKKGAQILTNHTNDAWFFKTSAPWQHFIMNVFRAVENRRTVVVCGNTGVSGVIEPGGYISKSTEIYKKTFFIARVAPKNRITFYTKYGDVFAYLCVFVFFLMIISSLSLRIKRFLATRKIKELIGEE